MSAATAWEVVLERSDRGALGVVPISSLNHRKQEGEHCILGPDEATGIFWWSHGKEVSPVLQTGICEIKVPPLSEEFLCWGARILSLKEHVVPYRMQGCSFVSALSKEAKVLQQKGKSPSAVLGAYPVGTCR